MSMRLLPLSKWQLMKQKEVSSIKNLTSVAPLLPIFPEKPSLSFDVAISVSLEVTPFLANKPMKHPTKSSLQI